jgi:predicted O-methyltransferase YrrM
MTWLTHYRTNYFDLLNSKASGAKRGLHEGLYCRAEGFNMIFAYLESLQQPKYHIVETGTMRNPGNWKDGQSARLFVEFVEHNNGSVRSVDIDPEACNNARGAIASSAFTVSCSDSVSWLAAQSDLDQVDLFYLDSWDVKWNNDQDSAEHHLKEFLAIEPHLKPGAVVAIDDNARFLNNNGRTGKGRRIVEYLETKNIHPIYDAYQIIYKF